MSEQGETGRVLVVDDEEQVRGLLGRVLAGHGYSPVLAADAREARQRLGEADFPLMLCDMNMPGESGLELVGRVLTERPETAAVMVTARDDPELADAALELGAYGYIIKPFTANEVLIAVANALRRRALELENRAHRERLELTVLDRTAALRAAISDLELSERRLQRSQEETACRLAAAVELRDEETGSHIERVGRSCELVARRLGLEPERCELVRVASLLHDVGKIAIPDRILLKPGTLTQEERREMERHTEIGYRILAGSDATLLELAATIAWTHHERFDGRGYPRGLRGEEIPLEGRIAAVVDVFDALTSMRPYRPPVPLEEAVASMRAGRGGSFDPAILDLFLDSLEDVLEVRRAVAGGAVLVGSAG